jgi:hypothetical protein
VPRVVTGQIPFTLLTTSRFLIINSVTAVVPNACNQCHLDKSLNWTIEAAKRQGPRDSQTPGLRQMSNSIFRRERESYLPETR